MVLSLQQQKLIKIAKTARMAKMAKLTKKPPTRQGGTPFWRCGNVFCNLGHYYNFEYFLLLYCKTMGNFVWFYITRTENDQIGQIAKMTNTCPERQRGIPRCRYGHFFILALVTGCIGRIWTCKEYNKLLGTNRSKSSGLCLPS